MRSLALLCAALLLSACLANDADDAPPDDCARYRDHSIELSLRASNDIGGAGMSEEILAAHKAQLSAALGPAYEAGCTELTSRQLDCALAAASSDALAACTGGSR